MRRLFRIHPLLWLVLTPAVLCAVSTYLRPDEWQPVNQPDLITRQVYAYRQWQYTGIKLAAGDGAALEAVYANAQSARMKWIRAIEFLAEDRKGFWEVRGYSNTAEPWLNDRYATEG